MIAFTRPLFAVGFLFLASNAFAADRPNIVLIFISA
jgi:hypothetical protein